MRGDAGRMLRRFQRLSPRSVDNTMVRIRRGEERVVGGGSTKEVTGKLTE